MPQLPPWKPGGGSAYVTDWGDKGSPQLPPLQKPPPPTPPAVDLTAILAELAALREAIENIQLQPGPQGETGAQGERGEPGPPGNDGPPFDVASLTGEDYDVLAAEVEKRLRPIYVRHIDVATGVENEEAISLGEGFTVYSFPPE